VPFPLFWFARQSRQTRLLLDALARARDTWPQMLQDLPMKESHTVVLKDHWSKLSGDFKV
jgi:hypothetical protein